MTLVDTMTGELVEPLNTADARRLTDRIRLLGESLADTLDKLAELIDQARTGSAWLALGYRSWTEYVSQEFAHVLPRLDREPRQEFVRELASHGMSTRAIAPLVGVSHETVAQDIAAPVRDLTPQTPAPESVGEADDGAGQKSAVDHEPAAGKPEGASEPAAASHPAPAPRPPVTGLDGKTYSRPAPTPKPVLDGAAAEYANAEKAALSLTRAVGKLLEFQHSNMREGMKKYWSMASIEVPPVQRADVTPEQMRVAAHGLLALADEWE